MICSQPQEPQAEILLLLCYHYEHCNAASLEAVFTVCMLVRCEMFCVNNRPSPPLLTRIQMMWKKGRTRTLMVRMTMDMTSCKSRQRRERRRERRRVPPQPFQPVTITTFTSLVDLPCPVNINTSPLTASQSVSRPASQPASQSSQSISGVAEPFVFLPATCPTSQLLVRLVLSHLGGTLWNSTPPLWETSMPSLQSSTSTVCLVYFKPNVKKKWH